MSEIWIDEEVESYFAARSIGPLLEVDQVIHDVNHRVSQRLKEMLELIPDEILQNVLEDDRFLGLYGKVDQNEQKKFARKWIIVKELQKRICQRRRSCLLNQYDESRPVPYDDPSLIDLDVSSDKLVPIWAFDVEEGVLLRNGQAYSILLPTPYENSSYWLTRTLIHKEVKERVWVRLDPLIRGPADKFHRISYRMLWWV